MMSSSQSDRLAGRDPYLRLVICADIHLRPEDRGAFFRFLQQLAEQTPARLAILGDLFEYWVDSTASLAAYQALFEQLRQLHARGWQIHFVPGNRELAWGRYLQTAAPWVFHAGRQGWYIPTWSLRLLHGEGLVRDPGYRFLAALVSSCYLRIWRLCLPHFLLSGIAQQLRGASQRKRRYSAGAALELLDPLQVRVQAGPARRLIAGHIHQSWRRLIASVDLILCGSWDEQQGYWVEIDEQGCAWQRSFP